MDNHTVKQPIRLIELDAENYFEIGSLVRVGEETVVVDRIEAFEKYGEYAAIPYIRVWAGDVAAAEFCQHRLRGVYFGAPEPTPPPTPPPPPGVPHETGCCCDDCLPF